MSEATYRRALRSAVRGLWTGVLDFDQFWDAMHSAIRVGMTGAAVAGSKDCNIGPEDWTAEERSRLRQQIAYEEQWITGLAEFIEARTKAMGEPMSTLTGPIYSRLEIWVGRWIGARDEWRVMTCKDQKLKWVLGSTEVHCSSCKRLDGKVKRASYWNKTKILPRVHDAPYLECKGFR